MNSYAIQLDLTHYYFDKSPIPFFEDMSFQLEKGKLHSLKGKNGSGKSTLFSLLRGDLLGNRNCKGLVCLQEERHDLARLQTANKLKQQVALVNQRFDAMIADQFTFADNLKFACMPSYPSAFKKMKSSLQMPAFLDPFNINFNTPAYLLSGGQRQILALSMVLHQQPSLLLLDEPTATLDPSNARYVFQFLQHLARTDHLTILLISHDNDLMEEFCDGRRLELEVEKTGKRRLSQH